MGDGEERRRDGRWGREEKRDGEGRIIVEKRHTWLTSTSTNLEA